MEKLLFILFWVLVFLYRPYHGDTNLHTASHCSVPGGSINGTSFQSNLVTVLESLSTNGPTHNGFYTKTAGKDENRVFGLVQCRGDVSSGDCYKCIQESIKTASGDFCSDSKRVDIWFTWCVLRYSNESFFGVWEKSSALISNITDLDYPSMGFEGIELMSSLANSAPRAPLLFQRGVLQVGENIKRYGIAQCTQDISKDDCRKCLKHLLESLQTDIETTRNWEIYGPSCSMWYHDYQFYFDYFIPVNNDAKKSLVDRSAIVIWTAVLTLPLVI